jgi:hypothetical protein
MSSAIPHSKRELQILARLEYWLEHFQERNSKLMLQLWSAAYRSEREKTGSVVGSVGDIPLITVDDIPKKQRRNRRQS